MRIRPNKFCGAAVLWLLLLSFCQSHAQSTFQWTVTFDGLPYVAPGSDIGVTYYYEAGVEFKPVVPNGLFGRAGGGRAGFPDNGTAYILNGFGDSLAATLQSGGRFGLVAVDLSEFSTFYPVPRIVEFVGYRPDGTTVTTEFTTDGIIDGTGPLADFQSFYFDSRFADLLRIEVPTYRYALDNMVFSTIPEPSSYALMVLGATLAIIPLFKRKS